MYETGDERFNYHNFQNQPQWLIRQALRAIQQKRNMDSFTGARMLQMTYNMHLPENTPAATDLSLFMPHPDTWLIQNMDRKVFVDRQTAILFLQSYTKFGSDVIVTFDDWIRDLEIIATGGM